MFANDIRFLEIKGKTSSAKQLLKNRSVWRLVNIRKGQLRLRNKDTIYIHLNDRNFKIRPL